MTKSTTRVETNIKDKESGKFLTFKINPFTGERSTPQYEPGEDIPIDWRRQNLMPEDGTIISASITFLLITPTHNGYRDVCMDRAL